MDYLEAAGILNLPLGTLKSRVSRARLRLRELVEMSQISF
jgi:DNA-directed RNA polymerase specialized sigma24 family protein